MAEEKFRVSVPTSFSRSDSLRFGDVVVDYIIRRSKQGLGPGRVSLGKYSNVYKQSAEFEIAGKSGSKVNLTLTGDMLDDLEVLRVSSGFVTIGYQDGSDSNDKARYMREKGYSFLGLSKSELDSLLKEFKAEDKIVQSLVPSLTESFLKRILGGS